MKATTLIFIVIVFWGCTKHNSPVPAPAKHENSPAPQENTARDTTLLDTTWNGSRLAATGFDYAGEAMDSIVISYKNSRATVAVKNIPAMETDPSMASPLVIFEKGTTTSARAYFVNDNAVVWALRDPATENVDVYGLRWQNNQLSFFNLKNGSCEPKISGQLPYAGIVPERKTLFLPSSDVHQKGGAKFRRINSWNISAECFSPGKNIEVRTKMEYIAADAPFSEFKEYYTRLLDYYNGNVKD